MRIAVAASALLHLGLIVVTMIAWPGFRSVPPTKLPPSIPVELVTVADETNIKPERKVEEPKPEPPEEKPEPKRPEPEEPKPERVVAPPPAPEPEPEAEPEPEPEPEPKPAEPEPEPEEKKPEEPKEKKLAEMRPKPKPRRPQPENKKPKKEEDVYDQFAALLDKRPEEEQQERVFHEEAEETLSGKSNREGVGLKTEMTVSMLDALKLQIQPCWNLDPGALNAGELVIEMVIYFNPDGTLRHEADNPRIKNRMRYMSDSYFRAAADAAVMAVRECEGGGYKLPPNTSKVDVIFDPSKMVGGR